MKCCPSCIGDQHLRRVIIPNLTSTKGTCSYCGSENELLIDPVNLRDHFELLLAIYGIADKGISLAEWLKHDWAMFQLPQMDIATTSQLLADILEDDGINHQTFIPSDLSSSDTLDEWETFRNELMYKNRFFPNTTFNLDRLKRYLQQLPPDKDDFPQICYRARIQKEKAPYLADNMGAPPKDKTSHGRANPAGIPYLYLASTIQTAISEIRPHTGEIANIAEFTLRDDLKIIDLRHPRKTVSPFVLDEVSEVALLRADIGFLEHLGEELTRPILPHTAAIDYTPSQYLCEFVKNCGYHGVMYRSSVGEGVNIALFNQEDAKVGAVTVHKVSRVFVEIDGE